MTGDRGEGEYREGYNASGIWGVGYVGCVGGSCTKASWKGGPIKKKSVVALSFLYFCAIVQCLANCVLSTV